MSSPWFALVEVTDGRALRIRTYIDRDEALEAAGLQE
jgi:hypothetical protein